jgi:hypothetical protein
VHTETVFGFGASKKSLQSFFAFISPVVREILLMAGKSTTRIDQREKEVINDLVYYGG